MIKVQENSLKFFIYYKLANIMCEHKRVYVVK